MQAPSSGCVLTSTDVPYDISMVQSSGDKKMDRAVFQAAKRWKFAHVRPDGTERPECEDVPVSMKVN